MKSSVFETIKIDFCKFFQKIWINKKKNHINTEMFLRVCKNFCYCLERETRHWLFTILLKIETFARCLNLFAHCTPDSRCVNNFRFTTVFRFTTLWQYGIHARNIFFFENVSERELSRKIILIWKGEKRKENLEECGSEPLPSLRYS